MIRDSVFSSLQSSSSRWRPPRCQNQAVSLRAELPCKLPANAGACARDKCLHALRLLAQFSFADYRVSRAAVTALRKHQAERFCVRLHHGHRKRTAVAVFPQNCLPHERQMRMVSPFLHTEPVPPECSGKRIVEGQERCAPFHARPIEIAAPLPETAHSTDLQGKTPG